MKAKPVSPRRTAFITGASSGIGAATALALAQDGFDLAISATQVANLSSTVAILSATGVRVVPIALDLRSYADIESAFAAAAGALGAVDVVVNNAAGVAYTKDALDILPHEWESVLATVLTGTFFMCRQMARYAFAAKRPGCIINLASTHGLVAFPGRCAYGVCKAGIMHMTRMLALEWAAQGMRVNAVAPGSTATQANANYMADPEKLAMLKSRIPIGRVARPQEIAAAIRYLASPAASCITGQTLVIDGGLTAW